MTLPLVLFPNRTDEREETSKRTDDPIGVNIVRSILVLAMLVFAAALPSTASAGHAPGIKHCGQFSVDGVYYEAQVKRAAVCKRARSVMRAFVLKERAPSGWTCRVSRRGGYENIVLAAHCRRGRAVVRASVQDG